MIALDTNVLVRFLVADDPVQARRARSLVERLDDDEERGFVPDIVLRELVWVLSRSYGFDRSRISAVLTDLASARQLCFESVERIVRTISAYSSGRGDFADHLIREHARESGCECVATFDRKLHGDDMFTVP